MELDVNPISTITNASFWKTEDDVNGALNGMYVQFRNVTESIHLLGEARSEVFGPGVVGHGGFDIYYNNTLLPANAGPGWQNFYTVINSANLILKYTPDIAFKSESNKNKILAQAYTMRAFIYFVMTRSWGDLVIRSEPVESSNAEVTHKERSSQTDVFALIKSDLEEALKLFPDNNYSSGRCYWSKPAVNTLKADVYLWTGKRMNGGDVDFNQALQALNEVVNSGASLLPDFANIFSYDNKGNNEIIMCSRYQELEVGNNFYWRMWLIGSSVPENIDEETRNILHPIGGGQGIMVPSNNYRNQFSPDDTRKKGSIHEIFVDKDGQKEYYTCIVLKGSGLVKSGNRDFLNDVIYYRYADALLMLAEAKNALGQDPSPEINRVRERAYKDNFEKYRYENDTKEKNDEAILKERLLELSLEGGKRWWDLLRFDKAFDLVPSLQDKKGQDYYRLFPIGNSILSLEPKVKQNPGWDK
jgi:predicted RNA-binding protein associated with RNAse of E/G family